MRLMHENDSQLQVKRICVVLAWVTGLDDQRRGGVEQARACSFAEIPGSPDFRCVIS
jgi:hypothetical protein